MPIVDSTETDGYATCARNRVEHGHCPGYESRPVRVLVRVTSFLYGDFNEGSTDPYDTLLADRVERSTEQVLNADPADELCPHCGSPQNFSLAPRPVYDRLSDRGPDELVRRRESERAAALRDAATLDVGERQAAALERMAAGAGADPAELAGLREEVAQLRAQLANSNGHDDEPEPEQRASDIKPRPPRKRTG